MKKIIETIYNVSTLEVTYIYDDGSKEVIKDSPVFDAGAVNE